MGSSQALADRTGVRCERAHFIPSTKLSIISSGRAKVLRRAETTLAQYFSDHAAISARKAGSLSAQLIQMFGRRGIWASEGAEARMRAICSSELAVFSPHAVHGTRVVIRSLRESDSVPTLFGPRRVTDGTEWS